MITKDDVKGIFGVFANYIVYKYPRPVLKFFLTFAIVFFLYIPDAWCQYQHTQVSYLTVNDGLSQSNVKCILRDRQGFVWFATDDGLNRYDGYSFTVYQHVINDKHSLKANNIERSEEHTSE